MITLPVDFEELARQPAKPGGGSPLQIPAKGLMANYNYAALDVDETWIQQKSAANGHVNRRLMVPAIPASGTYVLGCIDGVLSWIATEGCT